MPERFDQQHIAVVIRWMIDVCFCCAHTCHQTQQVCEPASKWNTHLTLCHLQSYGAPALLDGKKFCLDLRGRGGIRVTDGRTLI